MDLFLKMKHWQLFFLIIIMPTFLTMILISFLFTSHSDLLLVIAPIPIILSVLMLYGWIYSIGVNLLNKMSLTTKRQIMYFKVAVFIPALYMIYFGYNFTKVMLNMLNSGMGGAMIIMHLLTILCTVYMMYVTAKALKSVETQKESLKLDGFIGEIMLIYVFPIGIWFIQPRINKIFDY